MGSCNNFPWEIRDVEPNKAAELMHYFTGQQTGFVRVGPKGYFFPHAYKDAACKIYNMPIRPTDVFILSYPRSGSTWMRELVWMVSNDLNYAKSETTPLIERFMFLDMPLLIHSKIKEKLIKENTHPDKLKLLDIITKSGPDRLASTPSPRFTYTHTPLSLLPPTLLESAKVLYIARDPRDVVVSFYHLNKLHKALGYVGDFKNYWNFFINDNVYWTPYFENVKEAWEKRHHRNMMFIFYEELSKDLPETVRRVSSFLNKQYTEEQVARLCEHLSIDNFRNNKAVNYDVMKHLGMLVVGEQPYIRKEMSFDAHGQMSVDAHGRKTGGWREYFDEDMMKQAERWMTDNLRDTDLRFPTNCID